MADDVDRQSLSWGEYHMPLRTPEEIISLRERDRHQEERLKRLEDGQVVIVRDISHIWREARAISVTLHGERGDNGLRLSVRNLQDQMQKLPGQIITAVAGTIGVIGTIAGAIAAIVSLL